MPCHPPITGSSRQVAFTINGKKHQVSVPASASPRQLSRVASTFCAEHTAEEEEEEGCVTALVPIFEQVLERQQTSAEQVQGPGQRGTAGAGAGEEDEEIITVKSVCRASGWSCTLPACLPACLPTTRVFFSHS